MAHRNKDFLQKTWQMNNLQPRRIRIVTIDTKKCAHNAAYFLQKDKIKKSF